MVHITDQDIMPKSSMHAAVADGRATDSWWIGDKPMTDWASKKCTHHTKIVNAHSRGCTGAIQGLYKEVLKASRQ